jgi:hypothetical protein
VSVNLIGEVEADLFRQFGFRPNIRFAKSGKSVAGLAIWSV